MFSGIRFFLSSLQIRHKFLISFIFIFFLSILLCNLFIYFYVRNTIEDRIEGELTNTTAMTCNMANIFQTPALADQYLLGEMVQRKKLAMFNYIPEYQWIMGSSSCIDENELYQPLKIIRNVFLGISLLFCFIMLAVIFGLSRIITRCKNLEKQLIQAGDRERMNIGQELHDDLCPHLIGISGLTAEIQKDLESRNDPARELARKMGVLMEGAVEKTRQISRGLCPVHLVRHGFESAIEEIVDQFAYYSGIQFECQMDKGVDILDECCAIHLYNIARQAVTNAVKHSECNWIQIALTRDGADGLIHLKVTDNGAGIDPDACSRGIGLQIMACRAKVIGGQFNIDTGPRGTQIHVIVSSLAPPL